MKKLIILILLVGSLTDQLYAQSGITGQFVYDQQIAKVASGGEYHTWNGNGFSAGYFFYKNDRQFKQVRFTYIASKTSALVRDFYPYTMDNNENAELELKRTVIHLSYDKYTIWGKGEMDDPNIWYGTYGWDLCYEKVSDAEVKGAPYGTSTDDNSAFDFGFHLGIGYQHNFSHKIGAFIDFTGGMQIVNASYRGSTSLGIRMNLK